MQFSKKDLDIILKYVVERAFKHKLSDYPELEEITGEEATPIVYDDTNKVLKLNNLIHVPAIKGEFDRVDNRISDLQNQIDGFDEHGVAVSNEFGDDPHIGVSQKTITEAINKLWEKFEDITGETLQGINMVVTPEYFIGENGADIHITANTVDTSGIFEHIAFYGNGVLITEADNVDYLDYDLHVDETTVIMCKAKILGIEYTRQHVVTHYSSFWLGTGNTYQDVMTVEHIIPITNGMRGAYDVDVAQGDHIIIVVGESLAGGFLRADMNSVEIQFTESTVVVDGNSYRVFTSENAYTAGTYNIDING